MYIYIYYIYVLSIVDTKKFCLTFQILWTHNLTLFRGYNTIKKKWIEILTDRLWIKLLSLVILLILYHTKIMNRRDFVNSIKNNFVEIFNIK